MPQNTNFYLKSFLVSVAVGLGTIVLMMLAAFILIFSTRGFPILGVLKIFFPIHFLGELAGGGLNLASFAIGGLIYLILFGLAGMVVGLVLQKIKKK